MSITVIPGTLLYLNGQLFQYLLANLVAVGVAFALTYTIGYSDKMQENA